MARDIIVFNSLFGKCHRSHLGPILFLLVVLSVNINAIAATSGGDVTFSDIAADAAIGITYRRVGFRNDTFLDSSPVFSVDEVLTGSVRLPPLFSDAPGVAILDYDGDGDLDIYATNAQGAANSLYANQLKEIGYIKFIDTATNSGVSAIDQDSTGVCFGDIDNDGDKDLLVLGGFTPNRLFENLGNGGFSDITAKSQAGLGGRFASSCSMGDINGDGLLDILVANCHEFKGPGFGPAHNQLFLNQGENVFVNVSAASGIENFEGISWAIALVDYDQDGDADIVIADDSSGFTRIYQNDGTGSFTDVTVAVGTDRPGSWMGLAFGDLNSDGNMDIFNTNVGDYFFVRSNTEATLPGGTFSPGDATSGWFLGQDDGTFVFPGNGALGPTPFGWGASMADYDNDGDTDIIYHGGMSIGLFADATNPGAILQNDGFANFSRDAAALANSTNHSRRNVRGMGMGDLNDDGFVDIVSVSSKDWPAEFPLEPILPELWGGQFDDVAFIWPLFSPVNPADLSQGLMWNGYDPVDGTLSVEISSADNDNKWVKVNVLGTIGLATGGRVNRDGIGAVVTFTPKGGKPVMKPITGGASHASAESLEAMFGLASAEKGVINVLWPGGTRNRLYNVHASERLVFPEIPCSFDDELLTKQEYRSCVKQALHDLVAAGILSKRESHRFLSSAMKAFREHREGEQRYDNERLKVKPR